MDFKKNDLLHVQNLMKITRQGTFTLNGEEALAFSDCIRWLAGLYQQISNQIEEVQAPIIPKKTTPTVEQKKKSKKV